MEDITEVKRELRKRWSRGSKLLNQHMYEEATGLWLCTAIRKPSEDA